MAHFEQSSNNNITQRHQKQDLAYHASGPQQYADSNGQQSIQYTTEGQYYNTRNDAQQQRHTPPGQLNAGFSYPRSQNNAAQTPTASTSQLQQQQQQHSQYASAPSSSSTTPHHRYSSSYPLESPPGHASSTSAPLSSARAGYYHQQSASVDLQHRRDTGYSQESTYDNSSFTPLPRPVTADPSHAYAYNRQAPHHQPHQHQQQLSSSYPSSSSSAYYPPPPLQPQHQQQDAAQQAHDHSASGPSYSTSQYTPQQELSTRLPSIAHDSRLQHPQQQPYASHSYNSSTSSLASEPTPFHHRKQASFDELSNLAQEALPHPPRPMNVYPNSHTHGTQAASTSASAHHPPPVEYPQHSDYTPQQPQPHQLPSSSLPQLHQHQPQSQPYGVPPNFPASTSSQHALAHHPSDPAYYPHPSRPPSMSTSAPSSSHSFPQSRPPSHGGGPLDHAGLPRTNSSNNIHSGIISTSVQGIINVYTCHPKSGSVATPVSLSIGVVPHQPHLIRGFRVMYGSHGTTTRVVGEQRFPDGAERVELVASTPSFQLANRHSATPASAVALTDTIESNGGSRVVQLVLQALDEYGGVADSAELGYFEYEDTSSPVQPLSASLPKISQKRPGSPLSSMRDSPSSTTRPTFGPDGDSQRQHSRGSSIGSLVNGFGDMTHHSRTSSLASISDAEAGPPPGTGSSIDSNGNMWTNTPDGDMIERKPIARLRPHPTGPTYTISSSSLRHPPIDAASTGAPTLYRTTQISAGVSEGTAAASTSDETALPPTPSSAVASPYTTGSSSYASLESKASLVFESDLNLMALGWSHDEWLVKRRLVQFWRRQQGNQIIANFRPVSLQEINSSSIVISCIFREDKNECFVTSVDTIYLLEALVAVRFTVEEKNRIRRNLEGFKPITITKAKADSEQFFKLIMSFPNPKPRNIEKDVKVFPWKILGPALRKIISKYSAAYAPPEEIAVAGRLVQPIGWAPGQSPPIPGSQTSTSMPRTQVLMPSAYTYRSEPSSPQSSQMAYTPTASSGASSRLSTGNHSHSHSLSSQYSIEEAPESFLAATGHEAALPSDTTIQEAGMMANSEREDDDTTPNQQTGPGQPAETPFMEAQRAGPPPQMAGY